MHLLDLLFPKRCVGCGKIGRYFCLDCRKGIRAIVSNEFVCPMCQRPALDGITHPKCKTLYGVDRQTSFFHYEGVIQKAIKSLKYRCVSDLAQELVSLLPAYDFGEASLIPIPLHVSRFKHRGFNQAEVLGKYLSQKLQIPFRADILKRVKKTEAQASIQHRKERLKNMVHVFQCNNVTMSRCDRVVLFDDVVTTGATMRAAAGVLKRAGVKHVWAVSMAR